MIDLIHLERLRRQRYETAQRQPHRSAVRSMTTPEPRRDRRRVLLRIVSTVLLGWAIDEAVARGPVRRTRG